MLRFTIPTFFLTILYSLSCIVSFGQYEPQAPLSGHGAIHRTDVQIKAWANHAVFNPGWIQITDTTLGRVNVTNTQNGTGAPDFLVTSLGDSGVITFTFKHPIINGLGPDFVVFENGIPNLVNDSLAFLELAFVEVSSNGIDFVRFPAISNTQDAIQMRNDSFLNAINIHNLAGKYLANWGTPFDLEELSGNGLVNINNITHIRLIDVIGILDEGIGSRDSNGKLINDPFPTPFPTGGFDVESIGVLHNKDTTTGINELAIQNAVYPNPAKDKIMINTSFSSITKASLFSLHGQQIMDNMPLNQEISIQHLIPGTYYLMLQGKNETATIKVVKH